MKEGLEGESVHDVFEFCDVRSERRGALLLGVRFVRSMFANDIFGRAYLSFV